MLSFPTQAFSAGAIQVNGTLDVDDAVWLEGDSRPDSPGVRVTGRVSAAGVGRFYFSGTLSGKLTVECRRCLERAPQEVSAESHVLFADGDHVDADDPDVFPLVTARGGSQLDLRPAIREGWLLEVPAFTLCRPDCRGLCARCGDNLNQGPCRCARPGT